MKSLGICEDKKMSKRELRCNVEVAIHPSAEELAIVFAEMDDEEQAEFFNALACCVAKWDAPFCFQLENIRQNERLTDAAREIMLQIGEYAYKDDSE